MKEKPTVSRAVMRILAVVPIIVGLLALAGWVIGLPLLKSVLPGAVEMKANTALCLLLSGVGLLLLDRPSGIVTRCSGEACGLVVSATGLATFGQYAFAWQLGIDELLFKDTAGAYNAVRGRMSPYSAVAFAALGAALVALPRPSWQPLAWLGAFVVLVIGVVSVLGYLWNAGELTTDRFLPPVALNTAAAFVFLGGGLLLAQRRKEPRAAETAGSVERRVLAGFGGALLLLSVAGGYTYRTSVEFAESAERVSHTQAVRASLAGVYGAVADVESAQRDYLLTGNTLHKKRHAILVDAIDARTDELAALVADSRVKQEIAGLRGLIAQRIRALSRNIDIFERSQGDGLASVRAAIASDDGIATMERIRKVVQTMDEMENTLMVEREAAFARTRQLTFLGLVLTMLLAAALFAYLFRGISREVRERARAESEAKQANAAKDHFLATMSHEIRTPLSGLLGMLELLGMSKLDEQQRQYLEAARESGTGLVRIIDDVLDHAKIQAGKLAIRPEPVFIPHIVRRVTSTYFAVASAKNLALKELVDERVSSTVLADPVRIAQILGNFLSNAIKFTERGHVEISAELVGAAEGTQIVRFTVKDTGIGIAAEAQKRLFQPFEQAGLDTSRMYGGTGLGLAISRRLAEMMGGEIAMESRVGEGTTMSLTLTLPLSNVAAVERETPAAASPTTAAHRSRGSAGFAAEVPLVLAVDDHPINRRLLVGQLKVLGLRARPAASGKEAFARWQDEKPSLVITDCNMPDMDGYALSRAIREAEATQGGASHTPIIAWTANVLPSAVSQCQAAGMDDMLSKPADIARLKDVLLKWVQWDAPALGRPTTPADEPDSRQHAVAAAPIDAAQLATIAASPAECAEVLQDFLSQSRIDFQQLQQAREQRDAEAAALIAHRMKGASRIVGARGVVAVCERMEAAARRGKMAELGAAAAELGEGLDEITAYVATEARRRQDER